MLQNNNKTNHLDSSVEQLFTTFETINTKNKMIESQVVFTDESFKQLSAITEINESICQVLRAIQEEILSPSIGRLSTIKTCDQQKVRDAAINVSLLSSGVAIESEFQAKKYQNSCEFSASMSEEIKKSSQNVERAALGVLNTLDK